jgi:hypothetical protein
MPTIQATDSSATGAASTQDVVLTVAAPANLIAVVVPYGYYLTNNYLPPSGIVWDVGGAAQALTRVGQMLVDGGAWGAVELWLLWNPTAGTSKTLRISWNDGQPSQQQAFAFVIEGADQTATGTPTQYENDGTGGASGDKTVTLAGTAVGDLILGGWYDDQGPGSTLTVLNSPLTGLEWEDVGSDSDAAAHAWAGQAGSTTVGYNLTDTANGSWGVAAWTIKGAPKDRPPQYGPRGMLATLARM